jgi:hypothetical protein
MGTTTGILTKIMEVVVPQTSSSNLVKMPTVLYGCLLHLLLRGFNFSPTQMEGTGATVGEKYPGAHKHGHNWIPPVANGWGATRPISHKAPLLQARGGEPLTQKINNHLVDNSSNRSHGSTIELGRRHHQADPRGIQASSHPPQVPLLSGKARPASRP